MFRDKVLTSVDITAEVEKQLSMINKVHRPITALLMIVGHFQISNYVFGNIRATLVKVRISKDEKRVFLRV